MFGMMFGMFLTLEEVASTKNGDPETYQQILDSRFTKEVINTQKAFNSNGKDIGMKPSVASSHPSPDTRRVRFDQAMPASPCLPSSPIRYLLLMPRQHEAQHRKYGSFWDAD